MNETIVYHPDFGEQLTLTDDELPVTMEAALDNSLASDGLRITRCGSPVLDVEVFGHPSLGNKSCEFYPLDGRDLPVTVIFTEIESSDAALKGAMKAILEARAIGQLSSN